MASIYKIRKINAKNKMSLKKPIKEIESILGYTFKAKKNLTDSLIHPSFYKNKRRKLSNKVSEFERLEFLGDRVLGITISFLIFKKFINQYYCAFTNIKCHLFRFNIVYIKSIYIY